MSKEKKKQVNTPEANALRLVRHLRKNRPLMKEILYIQHCGDMFRKDASKIIDDNLLTIIDTLLVLAEYGTPRNYNKYIIKSYLMDFINFTEVYGLADDSISNFQIGLKSNIKFETLKELGIIKELSKDRFVQLLDWMVDHEEITKEVIKEITELE